MSIPITEVSPAAPIDILLVDDIPDQALYLPIQSALVPNSKWIVLQAEGGVLFLPAIGRERIEHFTSEYATKYGTQYADIDPYEIAATQLNKHSFLSNSSQAPFRMLPFIFAEKCTDQTVRLALVFQVEKVGSKTAEWIGRYVYHLPTAIPLAEFEQGQQAVRITVKEQIEYGVNILLTMLGKDINNQLPGAGPAVKLVSLYLIGSRLGGGGYYQQPEERVLQGSLAEEGNDYVIVRLTGLVRMPAVAGGTVFGTHYFHKDQLHTFKRVN